MYDYKASLVRVIDGDTVVLDFDLGLSTHRHASVRLAGIDAVERKDDPERLAIKEVENWFKNTGGQVFVRTYKDQKSFDRYIAYVSAVNEMPQDAHYTLNIHMVQKGFAVEREY